MWISLLGHDSHAALPLLVGAAELRLVQAVNATAAVVLVEAARAAQAAA